MRLVIKIQQKKESVFIHVIDQNPLFISTGNDNLKAPFIAMNGMVIVSAAIPFAEKERIYLRGIVPEKNETPSFPLVFEDKNSAENWILHKAISALKDWAKNCPVFKDLPPLEYRQEGNIHYFI